MGDLLFKKRLVRQNMNNFVTAQNDTMQHFICNFLLHFAFAISTQEKISVKFCVNDNMGATPMQCLGFGVGIEWISFRDWCANAKQFCGGFMRFLSLCAFANYDTKFKMKRFYTKFNKKKIR